MFSITPLSRRSFRTRTILGAALAAAVLAFAPAALAGGENTYRAASFTCQYAGGAYTSGNVIRVNVPSMTSIVGSLGLADIAWRAWIYRYANGRWVYFGRSAWIDGAASPSGSGGGWTRNFALFENVPAGSYAAYNEYFWSSNGARAGSWSPYGSTGLGYCTF